MRGENPLEKREPLPPVVVSVFAGIVTGCLVLLILAATYAGVRALIG